MKVHAIQTGTVAIKTRQREGMGRGTRRLVNTFLDRQWTDRLPILAWAIEHPEGLIVVDTGETARSSEPGCFPRWHPYFRFGCASGSRLRKRSAPSSAGWGSQRARCDGS